MTGSADNDAQCVTRALDGDQDAFRDIVQRYHQLVYACALAVTRVPADAADASQETFIRFHRNLAQYDPSRPLKPYLLTIAVNCARNVVRKRRRLRFVDEEHAGLQHVSDQRPTPKHEAVRAERLQAVREFIDGLPVRMREVCCLFYLAEKSCREIAGIKRMSETAVKVTLHRARKKLLNSGIREWRTA